MKLIYLAPVRFPSERAHAVQIAHMCHAFSQNGCEVTLVVPRRKNPVKEDTFTYFGIPKSFNIKYLFCTPWNVGSKFGFFSNLFVYALRAAWYVCVHKSDYVYSRSEGALYLVSFFVTPKKLVYESHEAKFNFFARRIFKRGVKCVAISDGIKEFYIEQGIPEQQILVAHDGIDESFFAKCETREEARTRLGISSDKPVVMYIGGLDEWKGVDVLFQASETLPEVSFVVIGGTVEANQRYSMKYPKVQFLGERSYRELADNQQAANILVCTNSSENNLSARYTSPLKLFSYMTSKIPILAADVPSITSVVSDKEVFLYNPGRKETITETIIKILAHPDESTLKAVSAHKLSVEFLWVRRAKNVLLFCQSVSK